MKTTIDSLEPIRVGDTTQWIRVRGTDPSNPALLLIQMGPGLPMINEARRLQRILRLEDVFTVVYWDQRGCGRSLRRRQDRADINVERMVADTVSLLEVLRDRFGRAITVTGFSLGATVGALAAGQRPDLVATLVAVGMDVDGAAGGSNAYDFALATALRRRKRRAVRQLEAIGSPPHLTSKQFSTRARWVTNFGGVTTDQTYGTVVRSLIASLLASPDYSIRDVIRTVRGIGATPPALLPELADIDLYRALPRLDVPVVMVQGRRDQVAPGEAAQRYADVLAAPSKQLVWFEDSAHTPHLDEPDKFHDVLMPRERWAGGERMISRSQDHDAATGAARSWMLYGASGHTGALIAQHAHNRGHRPILAGRNERAVSVLAERLDLPCRTLALDDSAALSAVLADVDLVLNAAGPFLHTATPLAEACLEAGVHYLDISNELQVFRSLYDLHERAQIANVAVIPGVGFGVIATNCLARTVSDAVGGARHVAVAARIASAEPGPGVTATMRENLPYGGWIRRDGQLEPLQLGSGTTTIDFPDGPRTAMPVPTGDLEAAYHATGARDVIAYSVTPDPDIAHHATPDRHTDGGSVYRSYGWARAISEDGATAESLLQTGDSYMFTAAASTRAVEETLSDSVCGALSPAAAFGSDFVLTIEQTSRDAGG